MAVLHLLDARRSAFHLAIQRKSGKSRSSGIGYLVMLASALLISLCSGLGAQAQGTYLEWAKSMGGSDWDNGYAVSIGGDQSVYTTGIFRGTADFDPSQDTFMMTAVGGTVGNTMFVSKLNREGGFEWAQKFGNNKFNYSYAIGNDRDDNVYVAGYFSDTVDFDPGPGVYNLVSSGSATASDIFVLKLDKNGDLLWAKRIGGTGIVDRAFSLTLDSADNVLVSGQFVGTVDFDPGPGVFNLTPLNAGSNGFILKLNPAGNFVWAKDLGQSARTGSTANAYAVAVDAANNVFISGSFRDTVDFDPGPGQAKRGAKGNDDIFVLKLDTAGNYVWVHTFGSTKIDQGIGVTTDPNGNVYFTAIFNDTIDFDLGAGTFNLIANYTPAYALAIVKLDNNGNFMWARAAKGPTGSPAEQNYAFSIKSDKMGNTYTTGYFWGTLYVDPAAAPLYSAGASDMFLMKLKANGDFMWASRMGGADIDVTRSSVIDDFGNVYATGWYKGTSDFNPAVADTTWLTSVNNSADIVIFKFGCADTTSAYIADTVDCTGYTLNGTTYTTSGIYTQTMVNSYGCDSLITLDLTVIPVGSITITTSGSKLGTAEHFTTYQWLRNGQVIAGATDSTYTYGQNGDYQVVVTNANGCSDTSDIFSVTHLSINDKASVANQIIIFPNPTKDHLTIQSPIAVNIAIMDIQGRIITQLKQAKQCSLKELPAGLYLLRITDKNDQYIKTIKIIKQ